MGDVVEFTRSMQQTIGCIKGRATLILPLDDTTPDFQERLYDHMTALLNVWDVKITGQNFPNKEGQQMMVYSIDVTDASRPPQ